MTRESLLELAIDLFMRKEYEAAQEKFMEVLRKDPFDEVAKMGMMLYDLTNESEEEALALLDYYMVIKEEGERKPEEVIMEMIQDTDEAENEINEIFTPHKYRQMLDGISYEDFQAFVKERGSFKKAYEDIRYSTKVIITEKDDLFDFLNNLIAHGYGDHVYTYLEDALKLYPADSKIEQIVEKLEHK